MVKKTTHDGSQVLNRSWSKGSSTGASAHDAVLVIPEENDDVLVKRMHISWGRKSWCGAHLVGEKSTFGVKVSRWGTWLLNQKNVVLDRHTKLKGGD
ncbi:hypothetical protein DY000_02003334 [Brassica cretica]|uniref:Uncharacterized protein n=1 Tax=Brassica cretica TaxID=69181 RepID=A0ABQ7BSG2_BRACR|nr:hypothetical protein DY000_02003334 [Brassica cretica]